ncbi:MAG: acyl--CoA ligase [Chloroflexota bacterium]|nr:acyl--CoA ligase [Chloroflexota bacterium]
MILDTPERIRAYTDAGWWGTDTIDDLFRRAVAASPDRMAVVDPPNRADLTVGAPTRWTYAELATRVDRLATALRGAGVGRDDVVMVQLPNIVELPLVYLAAARIGAIVSPLPVQYRGHELRHTVGVVEPSAFVTTTRMTGHDHVAMVREEWPGTIIGLSDAPLPDGVLSLADILETPVETSVQADGVTANDIFTVCWTSGTEAEPKGVPRSHNQWISIAYATVDGAQLRDGDVLLNPFPMVNMSGIGGMFVPWLLVGGTLVMHHPMALPVFLAQVGAERVAYTVAPPVLLNLLLANEALLASADLSSLRVIGSGSAPLSSGMVLGWKERFGIDVSNFFGSNEGTALIGDPRTVPDPAERASLFPRFGGAGVPVPSGGWGNRVADGMESRLIDPLTGEEVSEAGVPGELVFRGPTLFPGYYRRPEMTARAFDADGFYRTGDLFAVSEDRPDRLQFVGRARDLIIRGGMKIAPEELEALIVRHPAVAEVAVFGIADPHLEGEQRVCAAVVTRPDPAGGEGARLELSVGELRHFLVETGVAAYKIPREVTVVAALPRNPVGKVLKGELRERFGHELAPEGAGR